MTRSGRARLPRLVVLTRYPQPGATKTRLAPVLGDDGAAALHSELARRCVRRMHATALSGAVDLEVQVSGASARRTQRWLGRRVAVRQQVGGDLGDRLAAPSTRAIADGAPAVVLVGSDAPELSGARVREALAALSDADVVLGPALDGGYYLAALASGSAARAVPALFGPHIAWGTESVLDQSLAAARASGLTVQLLSPLGDIDRPDDLELWESVIAGEERARLDPRLSVVIPALDEEPGIASAIESAWHAGAGEVIVADGGSADRTTSLARESGARVVTAERGRARQLNAGAAGANGDILLFLHADTTLPPDALALIRDAMADPEVTLGAFRFAAGDPTRTADRLISFVGALRHRVFRLPYGDQAPFIRKRDFFDLGGFPDIPVMEDYELARRCARLGDLSLAPAPARTSARAWQDHGLLRTTAMNAAVIAGYRLGVPIDTLATWRQRVSDRSPSR
ncbi:MAG: TIGR04283 family arsenosugar biosynthesis glycosyltransferase [Anaerosomatales bacterium]|nr:TIGR04283 family arsenosugar biosynthesis glycosyltransferase [Anaerosomatales bacterium]